jgi:ribosomal protein S18 acetylase RimI-like enzyme
MAEQFKTRMATAEDEPMLFRLFADEKAREFAPLGWSEEQLRPLLEMQYRARQVSYAQSYPAAVDTILCLEDGTPVGRCWMERQPTCYRIIDMAVLPEHRNRGIGGWALRQMQQTATLEQVALRLSVTRNNAALQLYERLGFLRAGGDELSYEMEWRPATMSAASHKPPERIALYGGIEVDRREVIDRILSFLRSIGLSIRLEPIPSNCFLPGIRMVSGGLSVDLEALLYPGDLLHEAGHLAVMPPERRVEEFPSSSEPAEEMAAIAWSYAAALQAGIPPEVVFHPDGYRGQAASLLERYRSGDCPGLPILWWVGMTTQPLPGSPSIYPRMLHWLRETPAQTPESEAESSLVMQVQG